MAGNMRYESNSAASSEELGFSGNYSNGQKGNYSSASLDRSGSFREGSESRSFGSGASTPRATSSSEVGSVLQYLLLDPITMGDQKYTRSGELRKILGISIGNAAEDNSFGAAHSKPPPPVATEELKRYKASISETAMRARVRYKRFNESLLKLNKYCEASNLKKQHRNEMLISERSGTSNFMKVGIQIHRNTSDLGTQRLEERNKNVVLNKRVRSSVAELRADSRSNTRPRQQMGKDREMLRDCSEGSDLAEEKVRRMPAGGEGWDRKMKRKRSVGSVFARSTDNDGETKRIMHHKLNNEHSQQSYESQGFSTGSLNGTSGINKLDGSSSPAFSNPRAVLKNESDKASLVRDFADGVNKERLFTKANNRLNSHEDNHTASPSSVLKGKASRTPRIGFVTTANTSPHFSRSSGASDGWEQLPSMTKVNSFGGASNRKRALPAGSGSSSPPMAQWVGQRPQKMSRTRRANVVSPVSNHDEVQTSSEGGQGYPSDFRLTSVGCNGSLVAKDVANGNQLAKVKHEKVFSPARLSESEESGAGANHESRPKEKGTGNGVEERSQNLNIGPSLVLTKKNNLLNREDTGDGFRRQGRTGRGASVSRNNVSPIREKLESPASAKPIRNMKPVSEKNGSKSGRPPLKKISDRKSLTRGQAATGGSPDLTVESDDDREELLAAANYACNASNLCCSSTFWKKMEPFFSFPSLEDLSYLKLQLKYVMELHQSISDMSNLSSNILGDLAHQDLKSHLVFEENKNCFEEDDCPKKLTDKNSATQGLENGPSCEILEGINQVTPLYQRVLSALIVEGECEEFEEKEGRNMAFQSNRERSPSEYCLPIDFEPRNKDTVDFHYDSMLGFQTHKLSAVDGFSCNGNATINRGCSFFHNQLHNDDCFEGDQGFLISKLAEFPKYLGDSDEKLSAETNASVISTLDCQYQQTCLEERLLMELQSIGLHPEKVPDLADGEDEAINQEIIELQTGYLPQVAKKKALLNKIIKTVEESKTAEAGVLEQVAMDKLVELAYKKLLATKGSYASKYGVPKVPRQVALAFMKRTLARCRRFGDTAKSCFGEPPLRDVILAAPPPGNHTESSCFVGLSVKSNMHSGTPNSQHDPGSSGSFSSKADQHHDLHNEKSGRAANASVRILTNSHDHDFVEPLFSRGKKKEVLLDDVGGNASFRPTASLGNARLAGTKGKRSERERDKEASARNPVTKGGRGSQANTKGDRKTKSKPKQKTAYLSTSGDRISNKFRDTSSNKKQEAGLNSYDYNPQTPSKHSHGTTEVTELQDLSIELGIGNDIGGHQDLSNLFNFDDDGLPENDLIGLDIPMDGLEIPMDDLSELNMLL